MAKLPKYLSALPQLSWLCIFQSYPASCRGKIAAIQTQLAGLCLPKPGQLFPGWFWYHSIPRQDSPMRDHWQEDRCSETINNNSCNEEEKAYWNRVARSRFTARTAESSCLCLWQRKWRAFHICWVWKVSSTALLYVEISFLLQGFVFCPVVMHLQNPKPGAASQPPLPGEKGNPVPQQCSFSLRSFSILAKAQLFPRGIESVDSGDKCEWQLPRNAMSECGESFVKFL